MGGGRLKGGGGFQKKGIVKAVVRRTSKQSNNFKFPLPNLYDKI